MADPQAYESLDSNVERVRVNSAIIEAFASATDEQLNQFRQAIRDADSNDLSNGFQNILDGLRDQLASQIDSLPEMALNGIDDTRDLGNQRQVLRQFRDTIVNELGTGRYFSADHHRTVLEQQLAEPNWQPSSEYDWKLPRPEGGAAFTMNDLGFGDELGQLIEGLDLGAVDLSPEQVANGETPAPVQFAQVNEANIGRT